MNAAPKIYILDQITAQPGQGEACFNAYMTEYAPGAKTRGMTLEFTWITPAVWLKDQSNILFIAWSVEGAGQWWAMSSQGRRDPKVFGWWDSTKTVVQSHERHYLSDISSLKALADV